MKLHPCGCEVKSLPVPDISDHITAVATACDHRMTPWTTITEATDGAHATAFFGEALGQCIMTICHMADRQVTQSSVLPDYSDYQPHTDRFYFCGKSDIFGLVFTAPGQLSVKWDHCENGEWGSFHQEMTLDAYRNLLYKQEIEEGISIVVIDLG